VVMRRTTEDPLIVSDRAAIVHVLLWGGQTIAFAFSMRDTDTRRCLDKPELGAQANVEAEHLADESGKRRYRNTAKARSWRPS
jgi:hypothetical protein